MRSRLKLVGLSSLLVLAMAGCTARADTPSDQGLSEPIKAPGVVVEGRILPRESVQLSAGVGGQVVEVLAKEGDAVTAGQLLLRLDDGPQRAALAEATGNLQAAQAGLAQVRAGATSEQIAGAEAAAAAAAGTVKSAMATLAAAQANLARLKAGATAEEIAIAQRQVEAAKNALWGAQSQRDTICGQRGNPGCDPSKAQVQQAEEAVRIAELQLQQLQRGATPEEIAAAEAQVQQAQGQVDAAQSGLAQAQAALAGLKHGATPEAIAVAEAQVAQAQAAVEGAQVALSQTQIHSPIAGEVVSLQARLGERVTPGAPVAQIADLSSWKVETNDLTEMEVVKVAVGQKVTITPDALPDASIEGTVEAIHDVFEQKQGDITYTADIRFDNSGNLPLRWGMTVKVSFAAPG